MINLAQARDIAYTWHSGGGSPFYRFASNGYIDDEEHRQELIHEALEDIVWVERYKVEGSHPEEYEDEPGLIESLLEYFYDAVV